MSISRWRVPKGPATHVLMDGGILNVPTHETMEFYNECVAMFPTTKLFVVEQKTDNFKFFVDLDYKAPTKLNDDDLLRFCTIIHEAVGVGRCLIARARPRPIAEGLVKSGVHIHWPDLVVNRVQALNYRSKIIQNLGEGPWDAVIDASVYSGSGLRMLWSHKKPTGDPYVPWRDLAGGELPKTPSADTIASGRMSHRDPLKNSPSVAAFKSTFRSTWRVRKWPRCARSSGMNLMVGLYRPIPSTVRTSGASTSPITSGSPFVRDAYHSGALMRIVQTL